MEQEPTLSKQAKEANIKRMQEETEKTIKEKIRNGSEIEKNENFIRKLLEIILDSPFSISRSPKEMKKIIINIIEDLQKEREEDQKKESA